MAMVLTDDENYKNIADTIREIGDFINGETYKPEEMPQGIVDAAQKTKQDGYELGTSEGFGQGREIGFAEGIEQGKQAEYDRFWDSYQVETGEMQFAGSGWNNETFKPKKDISPTYAYMMFRNSKIEGDLVEILNALGVQLNTSKNTYFIYAFQGTLFTRLGEIDLSSCCGNDAGATTSMFQDSTQLHTIDKIKSKEGIKYASSAFSGAKALANLMFEGVIGTTINFQSCPLTKASIESVVAALSPTVTGQTATFKKTAKEAAFTADEWAALIATKSNWTFSLV